MPRSPDSRRIDLGEVFRRAQQEMQAQLCAVRLIEHAPTAGAASEHKWRQLFGRYLPQRYRAAPAFVIDSLGRRSRQIDLVVFDSFYTPALFPHDLGLHVPAESVYAVFEIKTTLSRASIREATAIAGTVRDLRRTSVPINSAGRMRSPIAPPRILAGLLAANSVWSAETIAQNLRSILLETPACEGLDLGCSLEHGAFERLARAVRVSTSDQSLVFFMFRLLDRLRAMGTAPAMDYAEYWRLGQTRRTSFIGRR
jgi:hypothetical protein